MRGSNSMRDFALEVFLAKWEFHAKHHMTASDSESLRIDELLALGTVSERENFEKSWLGYTETWGAPDLRTAIANTYETMKAENILCLAGAGEGLYIIAQVLLQPDDHVIVPTPNYQSAETVPLARCAVTGVPLQYNGAENATEWRLDLDDLRAAIRPNTKMISLNFPHNPTGMLLGKDDLNALIALCREQSIYILSDEVYSGITLDDTEAIPQMADIYERGISLNVLSKSYGLPGLRIGWMASQDRGLLEKLERYKHYLSICNSAPSEHLGLIALNNRKTILARNQAILRDNNQLLQALFDDFPNLVHYRAPMGGCVAFPKFLGSEGGEIFAQNLLEKSDVLVLPSSIYASEIGEVPQNHFRIGIGRDQAVKSGIAAMRQHFEQYYSEFTA